MGTRCITRGKGIKEQKQYQVQMQSTVVNKVKEIRMYKTKPEIHGIRNDQSQNRDGRSKHDQCQGQSHQKNRS